MTQKQGPYIKHGWYEKNGFVDYFGVCRGQAIAFEAKSTVEKSRFDLKNIEADQVTQLQEWQEAGGVSFVLVSFESLHEVYLLSFDQLDTWWQDAQDGGRKSIPYDYFQEKCSLVTSEDGILLHYLKGVDGVA